MARFNSRTREGCDLRERAIKCILSRFQFTHPGGVRQENPIECCIPLVFQFTHPGGVRLRFATDSAL